MRKIILSLFRKGVKLFSGYGIGNYYPIKVTFKFLISHLKNPKGIVDVQGNRMFLDSKDSLGLSVFGVYEPFETELAKKEIKNGDVILDIGANIGYYTLIFAKLVGESGKVFAFEPDPTNFALLKRNVKTNGYKNVILIQKAVSNKTGKLKLYLCEDNMGMHRIYESRYCGQSIEIESIRLDDYFKDYNGKIDFIKMDIEGSEWGAIQGMPLLLQRNKNVKIFTEFAPVAIKEFGIEPEEYLKLLISHGFKLYLINERRGKLEPVTVDDILTTREGENINLLCLRY